MKKYNGPHPPPLERHQFSIIQAEVATGKVLNLDGKRKDQRDADDWALIFESLEEAEAYAAQRTAERSDIECWLRNYDGLISRRILSD